MENGHKVSEIRNQMPSFQGYSFQLATRDLLHHHSKNQESMTFVTPNMEDWLEGKPVNGIDLSAYCTGLH